MITPAQAVPPCFYRNDEEYLRAAAWGTVWWPSVVETSPYLLSIEKITREMYDGFASEGLHFPGLQGVRNRLCKQSVAMLQCYFIDCCLRANREEAFGPKWLQQREKAGVAKALGIQRFGPSSKAGLEPLVTGDPGKEAHLQQALLLASPFQTQVPLDDDAIFACRCSSVLGPFAQAWRRAQIRAMEKVARTLLEWDAWLVLQMTTTVLKVAADKHPAFMAFEAAICRWPDRTMPARYVLGYGMVGAIEHSHLFRELKVDPDQSTGLEVLLGTAALENNMQMRQRVRPGPHDQVLLQLTEEEITSGFAEGPFTVVIFSSCLQKPLGLASDIPESELSHLLPRIQQITPCELVPPLYTLMCFPEVFFDSDVIWYIDNAASVHCLVKGASSQSDMAAISGAAHLVAARLQCRLWLEWVPTDSNIADGLSRAGVDDKWTKQQPWQLQLWELPPLLAVVCNSLVDFSGKLDELLASTSQTRST